MANELIILGFALLTILLHKWSRRIRKHPLPPGPTAYPIVGCLPQMMRNKPAFRWMHNYMQTFKTEIACFRLGNVHVITVTSPQLAREFFKEHDAIFSSRPETMSTRLTTNGYLTAVLTPAGDQWKKMKRIVVSEVLKNDVYQSFHSKRCEEADHLVRYVHNRSQGNGVLNVRETAQLYCGGLIRKLVFGERFFGCGMEDGGQGVEESKHMDALWTVLMHTYGFAISDFVPFLEVFDLDGHKKIVTNALACMKKYQDPRIDKRVEMWRNGSRYTKEDILDILINLKDSNDDPLLSKQEIKAQVNEIILAAIDNPASAVEWALAEMMIEPSLLDLAAKELDEVVGRNRLVQESDLPQLNFIKACVKEAFRLHPVTAFNLPHVSTVDSVVGGYHIPKGSHVMLSRPGLGRNPNTWDEPLKFKPQRHTGQVVLHDPQLQILSFSTGLRGCPAVKLGSTMVTMLLARLIQGFTWTPSSHTSLDHLIEADSHILLAQPLIAHVTPRLDPQLYHQIA
ncbi:phenylalanine N-monooxygenase-like [Salvia hispanica]|uniref:phenylalanine N-monooxygenase-like n=1 Tax=Salvia hispanica TaxID=49212 RepID=UPI0020099D57|nr:phenylalanine N-monooxygenase-like [Salvia hispanica]